MKKTWRLANKEKGMITFIIGLFIGAVIGLTFTSIFVMSGNESADSAEGRVPARARSSSW